MSLEDFKGLPASLYTLWCLRLQSNPQTLKRAKNLQFHFYSSPRILFEHANHSFDSHFPATTKITSAPDIESVQSMITKKIPHVAFTHCSSGIPRRARTTLHSLTVLFHFVASVSSICATGNGGEHEFVEVVPFTI